MKLLFAHALSKYLLTNPFLFGLINRKRKCEVLPVTEHRDQGLKGADFSWEALTLSAGGSDTNSARIDPNRCHREVFLHNESLYQRLERKGMGVDVRWENENGEELEVILDPHMRISRLVLENDLSWTRCLLFIDPYGDTVFNQLQIPTLISELDAALKEIQDERLHEHLQRVLILAKKSSEVTHTYLKFYGD